MSEIANTESQVTRHSDQMGAMIERIAAMPDSDVTKLKALLDMQMEVMHEEQRQAYLRDFSMMQAELPAIRKEGETQQSKYAKLEHILEACKPVLAKYGFSISFIPQTSEGFMTIKAILQHNQGHTESKESTLPFDSYGNKNAVQAIGSAQSYGMRYAAVALLAISTFDGTLPDLDGGFQTFVSEEEAMIIRDHCNANGQDESRLCVYFSKYYKLPIENFEELPSGSMETVKKQIDSVRAMKG